MILEIQAREILSTYEGANNQLLEWKQKFVAVKNFKLTRPQAKYVLDYKDVIPKVARKYLKIFPTFAEKIMEEKRLVLPPEKIWCEKLLCETDKAYHIWGKVTEKENMYAFWLPKGVIVLEEKKIKYEIDYSKYNKPGRPVMSHQKTAIEKLIPNDRFILADDMGVGKGMTINTLVYTPKGMIKIGDIKIGNKVIGSDGLSYNVIGVFPQGLRDTYKITFNDGVSIITDENHLWLVMSPNHSLNRKNERLKKSLVLSTKQMYEGGKIKIKGNGYNEERIYEIETYYKSSNGNNKWQIPIVKPIHFDNNDLLPINPYLLGLALGDGYFNGKNIRFGVHKDDFDEMFNLFKIKENKPQHNVKNGYINVENSLFELGIEHTRSNTKFIPEIYKYSSIEDRLSILQGLMDTDGYCMKSKTNKFNGTFYSTVSEKLCDDVMEIVHSLGGIARKSSKIPKYTYKGVKLEGKRTYQLNIKLPNEMIPFRLKRKLDLYNPPQKYPIGRYIKNIERCGNEDTVCISVDSPDKLYVAEHGIVTHNTTSSIIAAIESNVKKVLIVCPASLKINWKREIEIYTNRRTLIVEGGKWGSTFDFYIINYDIIKNYHSLKDEKTGIQNSLILKENFDIAIVDEAHMINNIGAQRTQLMNDILDTIPKVWLLTGTPMTSRPINYYNLLKIVRSPLTLNWQGYVKRYCKGFQFKANGRKIWKTDGAANLDELRERTRHLVLRRLKTDVLDLPEKIITPQFLELDNMLYQHEMEEFVKIDKDDRKKESISITLSRLMGARKIIAREKVPYTCELIDKFLELDKKVIVFTNFTDTLEMIKEKYSKHCVVVNGTTPKLKRQEAVDRFQTDPKVKVFIGNIIAAGVGLTLTAAEGVIMNDLSFVPSHHSQAEDRCIFKDQYVLTLNGYKKIQNINENDFVYTHLGNFKKVLKTHNHSERNKFKVSIKSFGNYNTLDVTNDHKVHVYNKKNNNFEFIESSKIDITNHCLTFKINNQPSERKNNLLVKNYIPESFKNNYDVYEKNGRVINLPTNIELTNDLLYAFGFYVAEGWSYDNDKNSNKSSSVNVCQKINNEKMYDASKFIIDIIKKSFNIENHSEYIDKKGIKTSTIYSKNLVKNFINWFGDSCENKKFPDWVDDLNNEQLNCLLDGFYHGDGYHRKNTQQCVTTSPILGSQLVRYNVNLNRGVILNIKEFDNIKHKTQFIIEYTIDNKNTRIIKKDNYIIYPIISLLMKRPKHGDDIVYDLTIEDDNSFVVGNYNVHNCNRIGQKNVVNVYYPIFEDTIEINIYNIIQRKKNNIEQVMGDGEYSESFAKELLEQISFKFGK